MGAVPLCGPGCWLPGLIVAPVQERAVVLPDKMTEKEGAAAALGRPQDAEQAAAVQTLGGSGRSNTDEQPWETQLSVCL